MCCQVINPRLLLLLIMSENHEINQVLENFYRGSGLIYGFKCGNYSSCDKKEGPGQPMLWCTGCQAACYCSRKCQKQMWKEHKRDCQNNKNHLRAILFSEKFEDMLSDLLMACLHDDNGAWKGNERAVYVTLSDLPRSMERPRYEIEEIAIRPMPPPTSTIAKKVQSTRELGALTIKYPSCKTGGGEDYDMYTEHFIIEHLMHAKEEQGTAFYFLASRRDPNYWKDFINQCARGKTPIPAGNGE